VASRRGCFDKVTNQLGEAILLGLPTLAGLISRMVALVIAFSIHEFAHAWTALRLGDPTAKYMGRLTLNPRAHLDVLGTIMVLIAGFGWAKPVPVNPRNLRHGPVAGMAMVAAAGPLSNLALAVVFATIWRLAAPILIGSGIGGRLIPTPVDLLQELVILNLVLMIFNLIPLAPLDGFSVLRGVLPPRWAYQVQRLQPYGPMVLFGLLMLGYVGLPILSWILWPPTIALYRALWG
jgi:Zn-dependent protease